MLKRAGLVLSLMFAAACGSTGGASGVSGTTQSGAGLPNPDGLWNVTTTVTSCYSATGSDTVRVTGGQFNARVLSYSASGASETVSIAGTITKGNLYLIVAGNETLTGSACNGANSFEGFLDTTPTSGTVASAWGTMQFVKQ